jgi:hypothetical protein
MLRSFTDTGPGSRWTPERATDLDYRTAFGGGYLFTMLPRICMTSAVFLSAMLVAGVALAGSVTGSTPRLTAEAAMKQYVANQARGYTNYPNITYKLGQCKRLFVKPWVAWGCAYQLNFGGSFPTHCYTLTIAIKHLSDSYRGTVRRQAECPS